MSVLITQQKPIQVAPEATSNSGCVAPVALSQELLDFLPWGRGRHATANKSRVSLPVYI